MNELTEKIETELQTPDNNVYYRLYLEGEDIWNRWARGAFSDEEAEEYGLGKVEPFSDKEKANLAAKLRVKLLPEYEDEIDFSYLHFGLITNFRGYVFPINVTFNGAVFNGIADFSKATFARPVDFTRAIFKEESAFHSTTFTTRTNFNEATFLGASDFTLSTFMRRAIFEESTFKGKVTTFREVTFKGQVEFSRVQFFEIVDFINSGFLGPADFDGTMFNSYSSFENSSFLAITDFSNGYFKQVPDFSGAKLHEGTTFYKRYFNRKNKNANSNGYAKFEDSYRILKKHMIDTNNHTMALKFYSYEQDERIKHLPLFKKTPLLLYKWMSGYGVSFVRPLIAIFMTILVFTLTYTKIYNSLSFMEALRFSTANMFPFASGSKLIISDVFRDPLLTNFIGTLQALTIIQSLVSLILLFFIGLWAKNTFQMK
ncbi:pentapeptide repeat-containing protein [Thalassomonas viridans]|uniref:Pentapeptide repeat-containing protein n=1 Tax=Thalassomonas viridans TaxID=137584 RepID=A0AAE9ZBK1_9GAMM|nr:pentapeptide repeat-containing protein [Thalassomonas viridans]WDE09109.1 pentapeptide repeat-containing protein [Thalassomonas viridans]